MTKQERYDRATREVLAASMRVSTACNEYHRDQARAYWESEVFAAQAALVDDTIVSAVNDPGFNLVGLQEAKLPYQKTARELKIDADLKGYAVDACKMQIAEVILGELIAECEKFSKAGMYIAEVIHTVDRPGILPAFTTMLYSYGLLTEVGRIVDERLKNLGFDVTWEPMTVKIGWSHLK